jgi:ankyrin repeat protein
MFADVIDQQRGKVPLKKHVHISLESQGTRQDNKQVDRWYKAVRDCLYKIATVIYTALVCAARYGLVDCIDLCLRQGFSINMRLEQTDQTPLQAAAGGGYLEVVERLLAAKADVNAAAARVGGHTALQAAAEGGHPDINKRIKNAGGPGKALMAQVWMHKIETSRIKYAASFFSGIPSKISK